MGSSKLRYLYKFEDLTATFLFSCGYPCYRKGPLTSMSLTFAKILKFRCKLNQLLSPCFWRLLCDELNWQVVVKFSWAFFLNPIN